MKLDIILKNSNRSKVIEMQFNLQGVRFQVSGVSITSLMTVRIAEFSILSSVY